MRCFIGLALICLATVFAGMFCRKTKNNFKRPIRAEHIKIIPNLCILFRFQLHSLTIRKKKFLHYFIIYFFHKNGTNTSAIISFCSYRNHYTQHRAAVEAARRGKTGRLESFDNVDTQQTVVPADDICGLCER